MFLETIIEIDDDNWDIEIERLITPPQLHYSSDYHKLMEANGDGTPLLYKYEENKAVFILPFIKKSILEIDDKIVYDIQSVYGYTGPLTNTQDKKFLKKALSKFSEYCFNNNIISELIRFNPVLDNENIYEKIEEYTIEKIKPYVILALQNNVNELKKQYKPRLRSYINKAERKYGSTVRITTDAEVINKFYELYLKHMEHIGVNKYYLMSEKYIKRLSDLIISNGFLIYVEFEGKIVAGLIFLRKGEVSYYTHGARDINYPDSDLINKLLFHRAFESDIERGTKKCVLGGGVGNGNDDNLFRFKSSFGGQIKPFYMGKRIHNKVLYNEIIRKWELENPNIIEKYSGFIDKYRFNQNNNC